TLGLPSSWNSSSRTIAPAYKAMIFTNGSVAGTGDSSLNPGGASTPLPYGFGVAVAVGGGGAGSVHANCQAGVGSTSARPTGAPLASLPVWRSNDTHQRN